MEETRVNTGVTWKPSVIKRAKEQAGKEDKSFSRVCEVLVEWALDQIAINRINSTTLKEWVARPPASSQKSEDPISERITSGVDALERQEKQAQGELNGVIGTKRRGGKGRERHTHKPKRQTH